VRIAYGVHGYGRGHATRVLALLPALAERHELLVLAGGDAVDVLSPCFPVERIPCLAFDYRGGHISRGGTLAANGALIRDLLTRGPRLRSVEARLAAYRPDVVVSDSEPLVLRAARRMGVPTIGFDHVGIIAFCRPRVPSRDRLRLAIDGAAYRLLVGRADRVVVSSFYDAPPRRADVRRVPPVLRDRVLRARPSNGEHLLVYFNNGRHLYAPHVDAALRSLARPVVVYGAGRTGVDGNVRHQPIDEAAFVDDLAGCRAVLGTGGHQLISEALFLGKPLLVAPEASAEQRLNAFQVESLGVGRSVEHARLSTGVLRSFLEGVEGHRRALARIEWQGNAAAPEVIESLARDLLAGGRSSRSRRRPVMPPSHGASRVR
jgi:uncharacterized protein (TIGR00661 family)